MTIQADLQAYVSNYIKFSYVSQGKESGGNVKFLEIVGGERREVRGGKSEEPSIVHRPGAKPEVRG